MKKKNNTPKIEFYLGDITKLKVDAIVNAANSQLRGGGGVDGAIHLAGGPDIMEECKIIIKNQGTIPTGEAVLTTAGKLQAKYVIHTVGPVYKEGRSNEKQLLADCYMNSLKLADLNDCKSIAFPCISTGAYNYPSDSACWVAVETIMEFLEGNDRIEKVVLVCYDKRNAFYIKQALKLYPFDVF